MKKEGIQYGCPLDFWFFFDIIALYLDRIGCVQHSIPYELAS